MTLEEIAALAGVSRSTVSRVVNNQARVSAATRDRVQRIVRERGYHPNVAARSLARRHSQAVGLVLPSSLSNLASPYYSLVMQGVTSACDQRGYSLMLSPATLQSANGYAHIISSGLVDGVLVATSSVGLPFLHWLDKQSCPFVLMGRQPELPGINTVSPDYEQGAAMAAQHLLWLGYRRIGIITGPPANGGAQLRRDSFLAALANAGRPCPAEYVIESDFSEQGGEAAMRTLLGMRPRPQAVFCSADLPAVGAMQSIRQAGLRVPEDIAIVGFDDIPMAQSVEPPLTTVRQPIQQIGFVATNMLIDILETRVCEPSRRLEPQHVVLPTELIVRESCGQSLRYHMRNAVAAV